MQDALWCEERDRDLIFFLKWLKTLTRCHHLNNPSFFTDLECHFYHTLDSLKYLDLLKILFCCIDLSAYVDILEANTFMEL